LPSMQGRRKGDGVKTARALHSNLGDG